MSKEAFSIAIVVLFFGMLIAEIVGGHHRKTPHSLRDRLYALTGIVFQTLITPPFMSLAVGFLMVRLLPNGAGSLAHLSFWLIFPIWFVVEEFAHYWLHRWSHEWKWLWKLHRTHHSARDLNVGVIFRYNVFWTFILPQSWFGAVAVYLGLTDVLVASALTTFVVNLFTHTAYRWDLALRKLPGMEPVFRVLEKIITLPDTHHAHHGLGRHAHMMGNYAVTIFLFDVLLGTARIPNARQEKFGLAGKFDWKEELLWPVMRRPAAE